MIRVPICGSQEEGDGYSSDGSVIRIPIDGDQEEGDGEDGYSSGGSVVRVGANEGACRLDGSDVRVPVASSNGEDDDCSSDGSVVRLPTVRAGVEGGAEGLPEKTAASGLERSDNDGNGVVGINTGKVPAHMKLNLLAASKYFGPKGGGLDGGAGATAEAQRNGSQSSQTEHDNPQVGCVR